MLEEVKGVRILGVTLDSKLTFETHLREVVSQVARSLGVMRRAGKLFDWMSSTEFHFGLLDSIVRIAEFGSQTEGQYLAFALEDLSPSEPAYE